MATNSEILAFMELFGSLAIAECNRRIAAGKGFILPSVAMAQSALESDWGQAGIMKKANAFFGVKAGGSWTGAIYSASTWEVVNGEQYNTVANFRAYNSPAESMADYYELTCSLSRYANGISYGSDPSKWLTAKETITALWKGGYATDELYVNKIMNTINGRDLTKYDALITGEGGGDIGGGVPSTPITTTYTIKKSDFIGGTYAYIPKEGKWVHSSYGGTLSLTKLLNIENSATYIVTNVPENARVGIATVDGETQVTNGEGKILDEDWIAINIYFDSAESLNNAGDFTITLSTGGNTEILNVLAYFVKIE